MQMRCVVTDSAGQTVTFGIGAVKVIWDLQNSSDILSFRSKERVSELNIGPTGMAGENAALEMFLQNGFELVARNYQTKYGEIDLIVKDKKYLVFAEVKTRTNASAMSGCYAVNHKKKQKLIKTFFVYLKTHHIDLQPRIDVIDIRGHWTVLEEKECFIADKLHWFKNAITSNDYDGNW